MIRNGWSSLGPEALSAVGRRKAFLFSLLWRPKGCRGLCFTSGVVVKLLDSSLSGGVRPPRIMLSLSHCSG